MSDPWDPPGSINAFYDLALIQCGTDNHKGTDAEMQGLLGAILELGYQWL